jgi:hypothetical protein
MACTVFPRPISSPCTPERPCPPPPPATPGQPPGPAGQERTQEAQKGTTLWRFVLHRAHLLVEEVEPVEADELVGHRRTGELSERRVNCHTQKGTRLVGLEGELVRAEVAGLPDGLRRGRRPPRALGHHLGRGGSHRIE